MAVCASHILKLKLLVAFVLAVPMVALAADSAVDADEALDNGLKDFGYLAGLSRGCVSSQQIDELEREVLNLHGTIGRLLGTDRAFLFAAAFGYGSTVLTPTEECEAILDRFEAQVQSFRTGSGEQS